MKLGQKIFDHDDRLIIQNTYDTDAAFTHAQALRDAGKTDFGESKVLASVPGWVVGEWLKEAGVAWDDPAADDVIKRKLLSGEVSKFRVWEGTY